MQEKGIGRATGTTTGATTRASFESLESRVFLSVAAPTGLDATLVAPRAVVVQWTDVAGETGYVVERRVDGTTEPWTRVGDTAADVTRFAQDGLAAGKTYLYRVRAREGELASEPSNVDSVTVAAEPAVPAAPRLEAGLAAPRAARLAWTNVAGEAGYRVERKVDGSGQEYQVIRTVGADVTTITDDGLDLGKTYLYRVVAFNAAGASPASNVVGVRTFGEVTTRPGAPRELRAVAVSPTQIDLRWVGVEGETGYRIERRLDGTDLWEKVTFTAADVTSFSDRNVQPGRTYVYRVRAQGATEASAWSNTAAAKTPEGPVAAAGVFSANRIAPLDL